MDATSDHPNDLFTTPMTNGEPRRSQRVNKGCPPPHYGNSVSVLRQSKTGIQTSGEREKLLMDFNFIQPLKLPEEIASSIRSGSSVKSFASLRKLRLEAELKAAEGIDALKEGVIEKRLQLEKAAIDEQFETGGNVDDHSSVVSAINNRKVPIYETNYENKKDVNGWVESTVNVPYVDHLAESFARALKAGVALATNNSDSQEPTTEGKIEKFLARQTNARDLPPFSGKPEQWPNFITSYRRSTDVCGITEDENMARLQKSLSGPALQTVQGMLISPENLMIVLKTLEMRFGRPEIKTLIEKARKTPSPKDDQLEMLIEFSNVVQNLLATMRILRGTSYMLHPELTEELASKMSCHLKLKWGKFVLKQSVPITLEHFATWLDGIANAASITSPFILEPGTKKFQKTK